MKECVIIVYYYRLNSVPLILVFNLLCYPCKATHHIGCTIIILLCLTSATMKWQHTSYQHIIDNSSQRSCCSVWYMNHANKNFMNINVIISINPLNHNCQYHT